MTFEEFKEMLDSVILLALSLHDFKDISENWNNKGTPTYCKYREILTLFNIRLNSGAEFYIWIKILNHYKESQRYTLSEALKGIKSDWENNTWRNN